jgi:2-methylisocitrate lyase-like PEP mutase family enzyme
MPDTQFVARRQAFRKLHESGCFVIPNPWDVGSAVYLKKLGFAALATTSAGFAFSRGLSDGAVSRDQMLAHIREIVLATDLPVNADFESGYAKTLAGVAESVRLCAAAGVAGLSIEDSTGNRERPLYELPEAVERVRAAREALDADGSGVLLVARAECFLVSHADPLRESLRRLRAYAEAGADVLYAPGPVDREQIREIIAVAAPKPVNVLMSRDVGMRVADLAELGVRRISVGSALARAAWGGFIRTAEELAKGNFSGFGSLADSVELNALFRQKR